MDRRNRLDDAQRTNQSPRVQFLSLISGKGGVGKSIIAFNLAERAASAGRRVLLVDADLRGGNLHILANLACEHGLKDFAAGQMPLAQAVTSVNANLDILAGFPAGEGQVLEKNGAVAQLAQSLRQQAAAYDLVILDHGSGISETAAILASTSDLNLLIVIPELTSIADAYGLYKYLNATHAGITCRLLLNRISSEDEADYIRSNFTTMTDRFLGRTPSFVGIIPEDDSVRQAIARQCPIAQIFPQSIVVQALTRLGRSLSGQSATVSATDNNPKINLNAAKAEIRE